MANQIPHFVVKLKIPDNSTSVTKLFTLPYGFVLAAVAYTNGLELQPPQMLSLTLKQDDIEIVPTVNLKNWQQTSGEYLKSMKPLNFDSFGKEYVLILSTNGDAMIPKQNIEAEVVFIFDTKAERVL